MVLRIFKLNYKLRININTEYKDFKTVLLNY